MLLGFSGMNLEFLKKKGSQNGNPVTDVMLKRCNQFNPKPQYYRTRNQILSLILIRHFYLYKN